MKRGGTKLHPLSIPYRAFERAMLVAGLVFFGFFLGLDRVLVGALAGVLIVAILAWEAAYHERFEYALSPPVFKIRSGVLSRREREIPLGRIQNVNINRNFLQRILNLAIVELETAGGQATEAQLRYVAYPQAKELEREIRRLKQDHQALAQGPGEPTEDLLFRLDPTELLVLSLTSFDARILGFLLFALPLFSPGIPWEIIPATPLLLAVIAAAIVLFIIVSWVTGALVTFATYHGFRLSRQGGDLQIERGLFSRYDGSVPTDKIQTLTLHDNPLKRALGYATLKIETAGYSPQQAANEGIQSAVPLAKRDRAIQLARTLEDVGPMELERPPRRARTRYVIRYALAIAALVGILFGIEATTGIPSMLGLAWYHPAPLVLLAPIAGHLKWKHLGYAVQEHHVITRSGFWTRHTKIVPYYRVQNAISSQSILQRRWELASMTVDTAGSLSLHARAAQALDIDAQEAKRLRERVHESLQGSLTLDEVQDLLEGEIGRSVLEGLDRDTR